MLKINQLMERVNEKLDFSNMTKAIIKNNSLKNDLINAIVAIKCMQIITTEHSPEIACSLIAKQFGIK